MEDCSGSSSNLGVTTSQSEDSSPLYKRKRTNQYRMSSAIKLEYDLSNPVYTKVKNLILVYILHWFLPSGQQQQLKDFIVSRRGSSICPPFQLDGLMVGNGVELMKQMWFTSRDNVNLLLEICRQGFTTPTDPVHKRLLISLYNHWNQVRLLHSTSAGACVRCSVGIAQLGEEFYDSTSLFFSPNPLITGWSLVSLPSQHYYAPDHLDPGRIISFFARRPQRYTWD